MTKGVGKRAVGTLAGWRSGDGAAVTRHLTPGPRGGGGARRPPFSQSVTRHCAPKLTLSRLCERSILEITIGSDVGPSALEDDGDALLRSIYRTHSNVKCQYFAVVALQGNVCQGADLVTLSGRRRDERLGCGAVATLRGMFVYEGVAC